MIRGTFYFFFFLFVACAAYARVWTVDEQGDIKSIKVAIQLAVNGDTIRIMPGIYKEGNLMLCLGI